jgi:predicted permease
MYMSSNLHEFLLRLKALFLKRRMDRDMAEELDFHQAMLREKLQRQGIPQADLDATTRRAFGSSGRWHERLRELWQFRSLENLLRDVSFSARLLRKSPGFTVIALLTLALGVGANTSIFSLINGLLLRPLPVPHAEQLLVLGIDQGSPRGPQYTFPAPFFRSLERRHEVFTDVFASCRARLQAHGSSGNQETPGLFVSGEFFRGLQTPPLLGRTLTPEDDRTGGSPAGLAAVISEGFWQSWFNRAPDVVGRKLQLNNTIFTVVGVMPKRFIGADPTQRPQIYVPLASEPILDAPENMIEAGYRGWWLTVMGRMQQGVTLDQVNAALLPVSMPIVREGVPDADWIKRAEKNHFHFIAEPGSRGFTYVRAAFRKPLVAVFCMCGVILLLACLNLASLLMARSASRERELATRLAMGATRTRLVQQLLIESLLIALMGTILGLAAAPLVSRSLSAILISGSGPQGMYLDTSLDIRVFAFAALVAAVSGILIGLAPALQATSGNLSDHIKEGQHATQAHERRRILPRVMLASEVALALLLVIGAGLLATSLVRLYKSGTGFDPDGVVNIAFNMDKQPLKDDALNRLYQQLGARLSHQPGVKSVSFAFIVPLTHFIWDDTHSVPGGPSQVLDMNAVGADYFRTMRIPMLKGREFTWEDTKATGLKVILNQAAARALFPGQEAIGRHILRDPKKPSYEVIAVVGDAKYGEMRETAPAEGYVPITQNDGDMQSYSAVVRLDGSPKPLALAARSLATQLAPEIPAPVMTTMSSIVDDSISAERLMALLSVFFAGCALLVTAIGLYGTLAYTTARRTSEIGIRMALGAARGQVVVLIFRQNVVVAAAGAVIGLVAAILASRALASFLYGTSARDPWVLAASVGALVVIASAASLLPALRAARIEPMAAIRCE